MRLDGSDTESLHAELSLLRKNEGFIQRRLRQTPIVDEVLRGSREDTFEKLKNRFVSAIHTLDDDEADLLLDVFALSPETEGVSRLLERRRTHGAKIGRGIDTVATREEAALTHFHSRLVTGTYAQSPLVVHVPEMHGGIIYEATSTLIIIENRHWKETREYYRFASMIDELEYVTVTRSYDGICYPHPKGEFKVNTRVVEGAGWNDHFWHLNKAHTATEPMKYGNIYDLKFTITRPEGAEEPKALTLASRAFHERSLLASIQVGFIGDRPQSLWKFEQVSPYAKPSAANEYNTIELDSRGIASLRLRDVHGGLFSGIAWEW